EMTRDEAYALIAKSEGRICARLVRRVDGTIMTRDCPVGLRAIRRQVAKTAGAVFAAIMTLCATVAGQKPSKADKSSCVPQVKITRKVSESPGNAAVISLKIFDMNGAVVAGADVTITENTDGSETRINKFRHRTSSDEGRVEFAGLAKGLYDLKVESPGFRTFMLTKVDVGARELIAVDITLQVAEAIGTVGLLAEPSLIDTPAGTFIISGEMIRRLPH
ncbi:MAG: carboxypeptidase-like regulatory domain-containing protein, partial [Pyrinomonadaceae bacterium]